ncbi:hypothetical protein [Phyllobacterium lublinensis]|uniref:hypothetical protein n=1 Tax=Phyllobacterium lublinensis TaxID=2875708 RepID=UPI001CCC36D2|nr:hypothetical protein [Phyllobacterium sp. 2063]MBZ9654356.1 hypothetical protein [Phyllobacterium sp. 2063]
MKAVHHLADVIYEETHWNACKGVDVPYRLVLVTGNDHVAVIRVEGADRFTILRQTFGADTELLPPLTVLTFTEAGIETSGASRYVEGEAFTLH